MALGEFGVASLEETSALCPHGYEDIMIRSIINASYFWDRILGCSLKEPQVFFFQTFGGITLVLFSGYGNLEKCFYL